MHRCVTILNIPIFTPWVLSYWCGQVVPICLLHFLKMELFVTNMWAYVFYLSVVLPDIQAVFKFVLQIFFTKLIYTDIVIPTDHNLCSSLICIWQKDRYLSEFVRGVTLLLRNTTDSLGYQRSCPFALGVQLHARRPRYLMTVQLLVITWNKYVLKSEHIWRSYVYANWICVKVTPRTYNRSKKVLWRLTRKGENCVAWRN